MLNAICFCQPLNEQETGEAREAAKIASHDARKGGRRYTHTAAPCVQACGPARPFVLPADATRRSRYKVLGAALMRAVATAQSSKGLGGVLHADPDVVRLTVLSRLFQAERVTLCHSNPGADAVEHILG